MAAGLNFTKQQLIFLGARRCAPNIYISPQTALWLRLGAFLVQRRRPVVLSPGPSPPRPLTRHVSTAVRLLPPAHAPRSPVLPTLAIALRRSLPNGTRRSQSSAPSCAHAQATAFDESTRRPWGPRTPPVQVHLRLVPPFALLHTQRRRPRDMCSRDSSLFSSRTGAPPLLYRCRCHRWASHGRRQRCPRSWTRRGGKTGSVM